MAPNSEINNAQDQYQRLFTNSKNILPHRTITLFSFESIFFSITEPKFHIYIYWFPFSHSLYKTNKLTN